VVLLPTLEVPEPVPALGVFELHAGQVVLDLSGGIPGFVLVGQVLIECVLAVVALAVAVLLL